VSVTDLLNWWPVGFAILGGIIWSVRLEGKAAANALRITSLEAGLAEHSNTAVHIARLEEQIKSLSEQMKTQNELIRQLVAAPARRTTAAK